MSNAPPPFPFKALLIPPLVPISILLSAWFAELKGHEFNVHGDLAAVMLAFGFSWLAAFVLCSITLNTALKLVKADSSLMTRRNVAAMFVAGILVIGTLFLLLYVLVSS